MAPQPPGFVGPPTAESIFSDGSDKYAREAQLYIEFMSVASGRAVKFKGFITDFEDSFSSNWNKEEVYGRMDPILTFQNTSRSISCGFDVPAASVSEAADNLSKFSLLTSMLYPGYSGGGANTISTAPLVKVRFSNWINSPDGGSVKSGGLVGAISGFTFSPDTDNAGFFDLPGNALPKLLKVSFQLTVLHTHPLGWSGNNWRGGAGFPYGLQYAEQPEGMELPDQDVTNVNDNGASGTDEMVEASQDDLLDPAGMTGEFGSTENVSDFQTII